MQTEQRRVWKMQTGEQTGGTPEMKVDLGAESLTVAAGTGFSDSGADSGTGWF